MQQNPFCLLFLALNQFPNNNNSKYAYFYKGKNKEVIIKKRIQRSKI